MERNKELLPELSDNERLKQLSPIELLSYKSFLLDKYSQIETQVHLVNNILSLHGIELEEG